MAHSRIARVPRLHAQDGRPADNQVNAEACGIEFGTARNGHLYWAKNGIALRHRED